MNWTLISVVISIGGVVTLLLVRWIALISDKHRMSHHDWVGPYVGPSKKEEEDEEEGPTLPQGPIVGAPRARIDTRAIMQVFISIIVLLSALYVLVVRQDAETSLKDWAYTAVGTLVGFWLKA